MGVIRVAARTERGASGSDRQPLAAQLRELVVDVPGWTVEVDEFWAHARTTAPMPVQGWKLHVSATLVTVADMLAACAPILIAADVPFKVARDYQQVEWLTHPTCPRENAGKLLTAYPATDAQAVDLARLLDAATRGLAGPRVLSDRCLRPGSLVHYRYGAFTGVPHVTHDGEVASGLIAPDDSITTDSRVTGLVAPAWATDPFQPPALSAASGRVLLDGRYAVREAIRHANRGGVFRADDLHTGRAAVVKQARAHVGTDRDGHDVRDRLRTEAEALAFLAGTGTAPELFGVFEQDGDLFVAEEDLGGCSLRSWVSAGMSDGIVGRSWADTGRMLHRLARTVARVHAAGAVVRDLSPNNVIVTDDGRAVLIDLEYATLPGHDAPTRSGTPAYSAPEQFGGAAPNASADAYSLGALALFAFTGEDPYLGASVTSTRDWLGYGLRARLVPPPVADLALALCATEPAQRPTVADAAAALATYLPPTAPLTNADTLAATLAETHSGVDETIDDAIDALITRLLAEVRVERRAVARRSSFGERTLAANVQHGAAGVLGVLAQAHVSRPSADLAERIDDVAGWLERVLAARIPGPVGLYFGWAGPCWALAEAGHVLHDGTRIERAVSHALALPLDWPGPDVTHGIAGLGLTLVRLHQLIGDERLRAAIDRIARHLVDRADHHAGTVSWTTPRTVDSSFAGARFHGYAHGTAGIGAFLDDAADVTGRAEYRALADRAAATLRGAAVVADDVARWRSGPDESGAALALWCNGSSGIATFLARRQDAHVDHELLDQAARACVAVKWHTGIAYCHGLSGNADQLLDLPDARYRAWARDLLSVMWERRTTDELGPALTDEIGRVTPDFNVGYGGALSALLRYRHGGARLWLPEHAR